MNQRPPSYHPAIIELLKAMDDSGLNEHDLEAIGRAALRRHDVLAVFRQLFGEDRAAVAARSFLNALRDATSPTTGRDRS